MLVAAAAAAPGTAASTGARRQPLIVLDSVHDKPGEAPTQSGFRTPAALAARGFDGKVDNDHRYLQTAVTLDSYDPRICPIGSPARAWVEARAHAIDAYIAECRRAGIASYIFTDLIVLPKSVRELYGNEVLDAKGKFSLLKPRTQDIHRALFREIGARFPDLDGVVVRTGEVYLDDVPFHDGNTPLKSDAGNATVEEARAVHALLIDMLRAELCERFGKTVIYRTWAFGGLHTDPQVYRAVTDPIAPHPKLIFSIKHTKGDFHRNLPFNPTLGIGRHRQIGEVQCQREYEGKGAYPNYIPKGVIDGFEELPAGKPRGLRDLLGDPRFAGLWTWSRGGGWRGPYLKNELWCELNAMVMLRWAHAPQRSERAIFDEYVRERFGLSLADADRFRELCLLSARGVLLGKLSRIHPINEFWARDEFLGGLVPPFEPLDRNQEHWGRLNEDFEDILRLGLKDRILAEKAEAGRIWRRIETLAHSISTDDPADAHYMRTSCTYGRILQDIVNAGWTVMLEGLAVERGLPADRAALAENVSRYDTAWAEFAALKARASDCATLYQPYAFAFVAPDYRSLYGMKTAVDRYRPLVR